MQDILKQLRIKNLDSMYYLIAMLLCCLLTLSCAEEPVVDENPANAEKIEQLKKFKGSERDIFTAETIPGEDSDPFGEDVANLLIQPENLELVEGSSVSFTILAILNDGTEVSVKENVNFFLDDENFGEFVTFEDSGRFDFKSKVAGEKKVRVQFSGTSVELPIKVLSKQLTSIRIEPITAVLGSETQFSLVKQYDNLETETVTEGVTWSSNQPEVFIQNAEESDRFTASKIGNFGIEAAYIQDDKPIRISSRVEVLMPRIAEINIEQTSKFIFLNKPEVLKAVATFNSGKTFDISSSVEWELLTTQGVEMLKPGVVKAKKEGEFEVQITFEDFVVKKKLKTIVENFDGFKLVLSNGVDSDIPEIPARTECGPVEDILSTPDPSFDSEGDPDTEVEPIPTIPNYLDEVVGPTPIPIGLGAEARFRLIGIKNCEDGPPLELDVTESSEWSISDVQYAKHIPDSRLVEELGEDPHKGDLKLLTKTPEEVFVEWTALYPKGEPVTALLKVTDATVIDIEIVPYAESLTLLGEKFSQVCGKETVEVKATGIFSDGTLLDITSQVDWTLSNQTMATIAVDNTLVVPVAKLDTTQEGELNITAKYQNTATNSFIQRSLPFTIEEPEKTGEIVVLLNGKTETVDSVPVGHTVTLTVAELLTCGYGEDKTSDVTWTVETGAEYLEPFVDGAVVPGKFQTKGEVTSEITTTIKATSAGFNDVFDVKIRPKEIVRLIEIIRPETLTVNGESFNLGIRASFTDDTIEALDVSSYDTQFTIEDDCDTPGECLLINATSGLITSSTKEGKVRVRGKVTTDYGEFSTIVDIASQIEIVSKCLGGFQYGLYCYYFGAFNESCDEICDAPGAPVNKVHEATNDIIGAGASNGAVCKEVLRSSDKAWQYDFSGANAIDFFASSGYSTSLGCAYRDQSGYEAGYRIKNGSDTDYAAKSTQFRRVCACREP